MLADDVLRQGIQGISELITVPALINLDFADVRTIMSEGGAALMAVGRAEGDERARRAAEAAISSALLDVTIDGARGILFNITGGPDLSLFEVNEAAAIIKESAHPEVNLIFGAQIDESMGDEVRCTVIATGFEHSRVQRKIDAQPTGPFRSTAGSGVNFDFEQPSRYVIAAADAAPRAAVSAVQRAAGAPAAAAHAASTAGTTADAPRAPAGSATAPGTERPRLRR